MSCPGRNDVPGRLGYNWRHRHGGRRSQSRRLAQAHGVQTSAVAIFEAATGLARIANAPLANALNLVQRFLAEVNASVVRIDQDTAKLAIDAFGRFGKRRHPAGLNMGDCFAYACARQSEAVLLCKGNDFPRTDIGLG